MNRANARQVDDTNLAVLESRIFFKDEVLDRLAQVTNVAQFVSFDPDLSQRYSRVFNHPANYPFSSLQAAIEAMLEFSPERSVNIRSFLPESPESRDFVYGLGDVESVETRLRELASRGLYTIVNETVDIHDGGVSGVLLGDLIEFAPEDTPRGVEKPGIATLPRNLGLRLLQTIYGFELGLDFPVDERVEFSIHPQRRGVRHQHTIVWQIETAASLSKVPAIRWPHRFSRFVGDKAFGLLIADSLGAPVPRATVIPRRLSPFSFGQPTGSGETWIRTCPTEQQPGRFTTLSRWLDPFRLLAEEDPNGDAIASVMAQEGVNAEFSGALVTTADDEVLIEGVAGQGDAFMVGQDSPVTLPSHVVSAVKARYASLRSELGALRMEWVFDGRTVWVLQLHSGASSASGDIIVPGDPSYYHRFDVSRGIEELRDLAARARDTEEGIILVGNVGITSHFGDILRRLGVPSYIDRAGSS